MEPGEARGLGQSGVLLTAVLFLFYVGTFRGQADGMILGNDAIPYAVELSKGSPHANPHHLLFHPLADLVHGLLGAFEQPALSMRSSLGLAITAQTILSALGGALAAAFFLVAARRLMTPAAGALAPFALTLLLAFSAGHWLYSAVGETYLPAIAAQTALLGTALVCRVEASGRASTRQLTSMAGALLVAVLLRQDSVLVVPAVLFLLAPRPALVVVGTAGTAALAIYFATWLGADPGVGFSDWLRGLADTGLWGGELSLDKVQVAATLGLTALGYSMWYAARAWTSGGIGLEHGLFELLLGLAPWVLAGLAMLSGVRRNRGPGDAVRDLRRALAALVVFLLLRFGFFAWWQPGNLEYHTGHLVPLLLLVALCLRVRGAAAAAPDVATSTTPSLAPRLLALAALTTLVGNYLVLIEPNQGTAMHARSSAAMAQLAPGGLVLSLDRLGHYSDLRAAGTTPAIVTGEPADAPVVLDASDVASGLDLSRFDELRGAIEAALTRTADLRPGPFPDAPVAGVLATRDLLLPVRFEHPPWPLDWSNPATGHVGGMNRMIEGRAVLPRPPSAGLGAALWELR
ncbi:MAG: hypothetical protein P1V81_16095 [Planctomycetota bacterium]|nr:hypothetical protein [Planctomycetota bacterium]